RFALMRVGPPADGSSPGLGGIARSATKRTPRPVNQSRVTKPEALPVHPWSKRHGADCGGLRGAQIFRSRFTGPAVCNDFKGNLLSLVEGAHAGAFDCADMNEDILASLVRLNEAETLLAVKPLHSSRVHRRSSFTIGK